MNQCNSGRQLAATVELNKFLFFSFGQRQQHARGMRGYKKQAS